MPPCSRRTVRQMFTAHHPHHLHARMQTGTSIICMGAPVITSDATHWKCQSARGAVRGSCLMKLQHLVRHVTAIVDVQHVSLDVRHQRLVPSKHHVEDRVGEYEAHKKHHLIIGCRDGHITNHDRPSLMRATEPAEQSLKTDS